MKQVIPALIHHLANVRDLIVVGGLVVLLYLLVWPLAADSIRQYAEPDALLPESGCLFSAAVLRNNLSAYGPDGRRMYVFVLWTVGFLSPFFTALFCRALMEWLRPHLHTNYSIKRLPIAALLGSWIENAWFTMILLFFSVSPAWPVYVWFLLFGIRVMLWCTCWIWVGRRFFSFLRGRTFGLNKEQI